MKIEIGNIGPDNFINRPEGFHKKTKVAPQKPSGRSASAADVRLHAPSSGGRLARDSSGQVQIVATWQP